jgi:hypothetical protein
MKILILISIDNIHNTEVINNLKKKWNQYINTHQFITSYFIKNIKSLDETTILPIWNDETTIFVKQKTCTEYEKISLILNHIINSNINFDYIFNTKITSFIILENLINFINSNNIDYAGIFSNKKKINTLPIDINNFTHKYYPYDDVFLLSKKSVYDIIQYETFNLLDNNDNNIIFKIISSNKFKKIKKQNINKKIIDKDILINQNCIIYNFKNNISIDLIDKYINELIKIFYNTYNLSSNLEKKIKNSLNLCEYNKNNNTRLNITINFTDTDSLNLTQELIKIPLTFTKSGNIDTTMLDNIIDTIKNYNIKNNIFMFKKIFEQLKDYEDINKKIDFTKDIDIYDLDIIYENIDNFVNLFVVYEKVLIVCNYTDDNYNNLIKLNELFAKKYIESHIFFLNSDNYNKKEYNVHFFSLNSYNEIKNIKFNPNIVICIDDININFKKIYDCFIITLLTKTFENNIDELKNNNIYTDLILTYSNHLKNTIENIFNVPVYLFYYHFIKFYGRGIENDNNFKVRKYDFGLKITNDLNYSFYEKEFDYLKNKKNIILLNDTKTISTTFDIDMAQFNFDVRKVSIESLINVKYIIKNDDIFNDFDIECLLNGCFVIKNYLIIDYNNLNKEIHIKKNNKYIIGNFTHIYNNVYLPKLFKKNSYEAYLINNDMTKEILIFIELDYDIDMNIGELFKKIKLNEEQIGVNNDTYNDNELINMYYLFGYGNININIIGLSIFYNNYTNELENNTYTRKFNKNIFKLTTAYYYGINKKNILDINKVFKKAIYHMENMLLISKIIKGYGGVQKSSRQIIETFDKIYNIYVISNNLNGDDFNYEIDILDNDIHNEIIIKNKNTCFLSNIIDSNEYAYILNNKLKKVFDLDFERKIDCICHNSMDPFNLNILDNKNKINKLFTINNFHKNLMIYNNFNKNICLYNNYVLVDKNSNSNTKTSFSYNIGFIGRLTKEKNVQLLIDSVNYFNNNNELEIKINLYIIGSGNVVLSNINKNIKIMGMLTQDKIKEYYKIFDYIISSSLTEGKPFSIIESLNNGIPYIHSNINGIDEIIFENFNGFLFNFANYDDIRLEMNFDKLNIINNYENIQNVFDVLVKAYSITMNEWNIISYNCSKLSIQEYCKEYCEEKNLTNILFNKNKKYIKKIKLFINFKSNNINNYSNEYAYLYKLIEIIVNPYSEFIITYNLDKDIDVFFIIIPNTNNTNINYCLDEIIKFNQNNSNRGKIIIKLDNIDKSKIILNPTKSYEYQIIKNITKVDYVIFNTYNLQKYYLKKISDFGIKINSNIVIYDFIEQIEENNLNIEENITHIKILDLELDNFTINKHDIYINLWNYALVQSNNIDFSPIGLNIPEQISKSDKYINFYKKNLPEFEKYHIYITDSIKENSYNNVSKALEYNLPILYPKFNKYLCEFIDELTEFQNIKIGESYNDFDDLVKKIILIKNNYSTYKTNVIRVKQIHSSKNNINKYHSIFIQSIINAASLTNLYNKMIYANNILTIQIDDISINYYLLLDDINFKLVKGNNIFAINQNTFRTIKTNYDLNIKIEEFTANTKKLNNDKINILFCSDEKYFVGTFASLHSVIDNTNYLDYSHFNFIIPINSSEIFSKLLIEFELKMNVNLNKSIIYIDQNIIDQTIYESKCYNGGNHLLNIGNFSRLMIGEFMDYSKLIYLDSDSIVQSDIIKKLLYFNFEDGIYIYSACANFINTDKKKQVVIKTKDIFNCDYDWSRLIGKKMIPDEYVYMGAPFITNCSKWNDVYKKTIEIIHIHNNFNGGIYKLFTMSIQNILFYNKISNINKIFNVLPDLGSAKRQWEISDMICKDILDWSGIYKPWYSNGMYKYIWDRHDIMGLSKNSSIINQDKNTIEEFGKNIVNINKMTDLVVSSDYLMVSTELFNEFNNYINKIISSNNKKSSKYKILYVCDVKYWLSKMSRIKFWIIEEMAKNDNIEIFLTGPGFLNFDSNLSLQQNILNIGINFSLVIWFNPMNKNYNFELNNKLPFITCLIYNEMGDEKNTCNEINLTFTDIIICHHLNDYLRYSTKIYENKNICKFFYIPHHSNSHIFNNTNVDKDIDILISGIITKEHYPLKYRLVELINKNKNTTLSKYCIFTHKHPGYKNSYSFTSIHQIQYNNIINRSKLCLCCTSKYNYRLGKYVEIPMAGSVILGDLPYTDKKDKFNNFIVEINMNMSDEEILNKIIYVLDNNEILEKKRNYAIEWAKDLNILNYIDKFMGIVKKINNDKIFIISDDSNNYYTTIKNNFIEFIPQYTTDKIYESSVIWYLTSYNYNYIPFGLSETKWMNILKNKKVIFTCNQNISNIDENIDENNLEKQFEFIKKYGKKFHSISINDKNKYSKYLEKIKIINKKLWFDNNFYFPIENKIELKNKYKLPIGIYFIGYFINDDTIVIDEYNDIFFKIISDMYEENKNIGIIFNGIISSDLINNITKLGIHHKYYFEFTFDDEINELLNCLDLYIITSNDNIFDDIIYRAGLSKIPLISTKCGIAPELMARSSLFDFNNWLSYKGAKPNIELLYSNIKKLNSNENMEEFKNYLFN